MISKEEYQSRRTKFMQSLGNGVAIVKGASESHNYGIDYYFNQADDFFYLTGFNEPNAVALFAPNSVNQKFVMFVQPKDLAQEVWNGYREGIEGAQTNFGAEIAYNIDQLKEILPKYLEKADSLFYKFDIDEEFNTSILNMYRTSLTAKVRSGYGPSSLKDFTSVLHSMRQEKSLAEINIMRKSAEISCKTHKHIMDIVKPGIYENEILGEIDKMFKTLGAEGPAYQSIIAGGSNACVLHYVKNNMRVDENQLVLIDAGSALNHYAADITRTFPVSKKFTPEQKALYEIVLRANKAAIEVVKPGIPHSKVHETALRIIVEGLVELGLLQGTVETLIETNAYKPYFMHGTSHWMGLKVHDVGQYKVENQSILLQPGMVFSVEPGIYISKFTEPAANQPEIPERYRGIGIRIEDDILVTNNGYENLTVGAPKEIAELEA